MDVNSLQAMFPDNTYGVDSGGDPQVIPKLTFDEFKVCCTSPIALFSKQLLHCLIICFFFFHFLLGAFIWHKK